MNHIWMVEFFKDGKWVIEDSSPCASYKDAVQWAKTLSDFGDKTRVIKYVPVSN